MTFEEWSLILFSLILLGFFVVQYIIPTLADLPAKTNEINVTPYTPDLSYKNTLNVNFTYNITWNVSNANPINCTLMGNFTGGFWTNYSMNTTSILNNEINGINYTFSSDGPYIWNIYCYNESGNNGTYSAANYTITVDTTYPVYSGNDSQKVSTYSPSAYSNFSITWTETNIAGIYIENNFTGNLVNASMFGTYPSYYYNTTPLGAKTYQYRFVANDSAGNTNATDVFYFTIPPASRTTDILFDQTSPMSYETQLNTTCTVSAGSDDGTIKLYRNISGVYTDVTPAENNRTIMLPAGYWEYICNITEGSNYTSAATTGYFNINKKNANVIVYPPTQTITYGTSVNQYCIANSTLFNCTLYRNTSQVTNGTTEVLGSATYFYVANISDTANYTNCENSSTLTVSKAPVILHIAINGTESDQNYTYENVTNVTGWSDSSGQNLTFTLWRNNTNITSDNIASDISILGAATYTYVFNNSATANYSANTTSRILTITPKNINIYLALNETQDNKTYTYPQAVNATAWKDITVNNEGNVTLSRDDVGKGSGQVVSENILLGYGSYNYSATFSATNYTATSILNNRFALVNKGPTDINLYLNNTRGNFSYEIDQVANFTVVLNVSGKNVNLTTNITGFFDQNNVTPLINYTTLTTAGTYNITGYWLGDLNYSSDSETWYVTVITTTTTTTPTTVPPSGGGGGGGGGGSPTPQEKKKSKSWDKITPGKEEIMNVDDPDIGLKMIYIAVKIPVQSVTISVIKLLGKPASVVNEISGKVYKYIEIKADNINETYIDKVKIQFQVNKSWISSNNINRATIALNRYKDNNWQKLTTKELSEDKDYVYFEVETPGFSIFAVTGEQIVSTIITTTVASTVSTTTITTTTAATRVTKTIHIVPTDIVGTIKIWTPAVIMLVFILMISVWLIYGYYSSFIYEKDTDYTSENVPSKN